MKKYMFILTFILTFATIILASLLNFVKVDNYSIGSILTNQSITYLISEENRIYANQQKEIKINNYQLKVKIGEKFKENNLIYYLLEDLPSEIDNGTCRIKMGQQSLIVFLFDKML